MDIEAVKLKADCARAVRNFFTQAGYVEVDTPCLSSFIIPESSIEVFETENMLSGEKRWLLPSPEVYIKKLLAQHKCSMFELAHCFRAGDASGRIHSPEFTMLEYYTVDADYKDSIRITEKFFAYLAHELKDNPMYDKACCVPFTLPFIVICMDDAFQTYAGFRLSENQTKDQLLAQIKRLHINAEHVEDYSYCELYELVLVNLIEPALPHNRVVALMDYPAVSETLSVRKSVNGMPVTERWECYVNGIELANCYSEMSDGTQVEKFLNTELTARKQSGMTEITVPPDFKTTCENLPHCSGVALGFERLLMLMTGKKSIDNFIAAS